MRKDRVGARSCASRAAHGYQSSRNGSATFEDVIGPQLRRRDRPTSTGAIETKRREIKKHISLQRGTYRTLPRLDITLGLMTLRLNRLDNEKEYERIISGAR